MGAKSPLCELLAHAKLCLGGQTKAFLSLPSNENKVAMNSPDSNLEELVDYATERVQ